MIKEMHEKQKEIMELEQEQIYDGMTVAQVFGKIERLRYLYDEYHKRFVNLTKTINKE